jgi:type III pantothenate kinase
MCTVLVVDAGNSNIHFGVFSAQHLLHQFRVASRSDWTIDELQLVIQLMLQNEQLAVNAMDGVVVSCVVPQLSLLLGNLFADRFGIAPLMVGPGVRTGLAIGADHPREIGTDRIVNLVGAALRYGAPAIVVDLGTATTFSVVDADKHYLGGAIAPGVGTAVDGLVARAARLPHIELAVPRQVIGKNTTSSMQSGALYGMASLVDGMVGRIRREVAQSYPVIATGGLASIITPLCLTEMAHDPELTLYGLQQIYQLNSAM